MDIKSLLDRCRQGDQAAEQELVCYFVSRVSGFAEKRIAPLYKRRFDGDDVANSVMKSLILKVRKGMIDCEDEWKLWSLLLLMTKRKVNRRVREAQQAKRDIRREFLPAVSEDVSGIELADIVENSDNESYDESALLLEKALLHIESHQAKATAPSHREVLELTMRGTPYSEICETLKKRVGKRDQSKDDSTKNARYSRSCSRSCGCRIGVICSSYSNWGFTGFGSARFLLERSPRRVFAR